MRNCLILGWNAESHSLSSDFISTMRGAGWNVSRQLLDQNEPNSCLPSGARGAAAFPASVEIIQKIKNLDEEDIVLVEAADANAVQSLFSIRALRCGEALFPASLHVLIARNEGSARRAELRLLLRAGSPFHKTYLNHEDASALWKDEGELVAHGNEQDRLAIVFSSLWGRVGSSAIFDSQVAYLLSRGYFVVRVFVDHWPTTSARPSGLLEQELAETHPHLWLLAERRTDMSSQRRIYEGEQFQSASPVLRTQLLFEDAAVESPELLTTLASKAEVAVVNHAFLFRFAERWVRCPIILETQDIFSDLLDSHGIPAFVPPGVDSRPRRLGEERETWRRAAACVNLSSEDNELIVKTNPSSYLVRPYIEPKSISDDAEKQYDLLLWGSHHNGNIEGINWFFNEVLVRSPAIAKCRIAVAGSVCEARTLSLPSSVEVLGRVSDISATFERSAILVIPDQSGTGTSIKLIDAAAHGKCFASTAIGMRGAQLPSAIGFQPSANAETLASDIERLLIDPEKRQERAAAARAIYDANFSKERYEASWDKLMHNLSSTTQAVPAIETTASEKDYSLTAIICTHNRYESVSNAIDSLISQTLGASLHIVIVDNSSDPEKARLFSRRYHEAENIDYVYEPKPGLSRARNIGLRFAKADLVAYLDDDAIASPDWARNIVAAFDDYPAAVALGGRISPRWVEEPPSWVKGPLLSYLAIVDLGAHTRPLVEREWIAGCNMAFRREILSTLGGFSEGLGRIGEGTNLLSNEEIQIIDELRRQGHPVLYVPSASVEHVINPARLNPAWYYKRMAWQVVSEFLTNGTQASEYAVRSGTRVQKVLQEGWHRNDDIGDQMGFIYDLMSASLAGTFQFSGERPVVRHRSRFLSNLKSMPSKVVTKTMRALKLK